MKPKTVAWLREDLERGEPRTPAAEGLTADDRAVIASVTAAEGLREPGEPLPPDMHRWAELLACLVGWWPSKQRPLPGNEVL